MAQDDSKKKEGSAQTRYIDAEKDMGFSNPMLEKVRALLTSTEPERWRMGGEDFSSALRCARPRSAYDQVLVRDIPVGSLVLHMTQPVTSKYEPGGYALTPVGTPNYTIEVRDKIFDANKVVDPRYADNLKGKRCDVIASGDIAKSLFIQIRETIRTLSRDKQKSFDERSREMVNTITERIAETSIEEWEKSKDLVEQTEDIRYVTAMEGITVEVGKKTKDWESQYRLVLSQDNLRFDRTSPTLAAKCFRQLEQMEQGAQLLALTETLKGLGFERDKE